MISLIVVIAVVVLLVIYYFNCNNREVALRKEAEAQKGKVETVHDTMWKTLKQEAGVTEEYKNAFEKIYPDLIAGRYSGDSGNLMKFITESNPQFDSSLYQHLMQAIEVQRTSFANAQQRMLDVIRERDTLLETMPSKWFISNKSKIDYKIISSTVSKSAMQTGIDDDIKLF